MAAVTENLTILNQIGEWFSDFYSEASAPIKTEIRSKWEQWKADQTITMVKWKEEKSQEMVKWTKDNWKPLVIAGGIFALPIIALKWILS